MTHTTPALPARKGRRYSNATVELGLQLLAESGSPKTAAERLNEQLGLTVDESVVRRWRDTKLDRYNEIREHIGPKLEAEAIEQARHIIIKAGQRELEALDNIDFSRMDPKDIPGAFRNFSVGKSLNIEKVVLPLTGRPSTITEHRTPEDIIASLQRLAPKAVQSQTLDSTAEDITSHSTALTAVCR